MYPVVASSPTERDHRVFVACREQKSTWFPRALLSLNVFNWKFDSFSVLYIFRIGIDKLFYNKWNFGQILAFLNSGPSATLYWIQLTFSLPFLAVLTHKRVLIHYQARLYIPKSFPVSKYYPLFPHYMKPYKILFFVITWSRKSPNLQIYKALSTPYKPSWIPELSHTGYQHFFPGVQKSKPLANTFETLEYITIVV